MRPGEPRSTLHIDADPSALALIAALLQGGALRRRLYSPWARGLGWAATRSGRRIGAGGMGVVFEAHDLELDRVVAIKVHRSDDRLRTRIAREARALASLSHANVVPIYDVGSTDQYTYLVMERLHGMTLARWCRTATPTTREIVSVLAAVARGLLRDSRVRLGAPRHQAEQHRRRRRWPRADRRFRARARGRRSLIGGGTRVTSS